MQEVKDEFNQPSPHSGSLRTDDPSVICNKVLDNLR
jgi:hypothetical protein